MVEKGEKLNYVDEDGNTLLQYAAYEGWYQIVKLLLENSRCESIHGANRGKEGAKLNIVNNYDETPLDFAVLKEH